MDLAEFQRRLSALLADAAEVGLSAVDLADELDLQEQALRDNSVDVD